MLKAEKWFDYGFDGGGMNQYCTWNRVGELARKLIDRDYAR